MHQFAQSSAGSSSCKIWLNPIRNNEINNSHTLYHASDSLINNIPNFNPMTPRIPQYLPIPELVVKEKKSWHVHNEFLNKYIKTNINNLVRS